ncbi:hypothetical protein EMPS_03094 [Entomortierella parvispora]|uniref:DUF202 domain-containing protein n=1 Tax=Entomortierella parvispora TaxID=205924 RepID=A0A9P3H640_9FUNG|nr:hypothetical protein EMPS_03094 [Entomortierella parvispora]
MDNQHRQQPRQEDHFQWPQQQPLLPSSSLFTSSQPPPLSSSFHSSHPSSSTSLPPTVPYRSRPQFPPQHQLQQQQQRQQLSHPYQPATPVRPQVSSQFNQAHFHSHNHHHQQQPQQQQQSPFTYNQSNNFTIPKRESSYPVPSNQPKFSHPLSVEDVPLESPQPHFATFERISTSLTDRPTSVASFSNLSSHSNEALHSRAPSGESTPLFSENHLLLHHQQQQQTPLPRSRKQKQPFGRMNVSAPARTYHPAHQQEMSSRSITPQPWHPDYEGNTQRLSRMDLIDSPVRENQRRRSSSQSSSGSSTRASGRKNNNNEKNGQQSPANGGLVKTRKGIFSRLRRARTFVEYDNRKTGRFAQFSNERLYLHWIRFGVLQGSIAVMLLSFGIGVASYVGVGALVLALTTLIYSTTLYHTRHLYMITKRQDILYYERVIPTMLALGLVVLYAANFGITLSLGDSAASPPPWTDNDVHF